MTTTEPAAAPRARHTAYSIVSRYRDRVTDAVDEYRRAALAAIQKRTRGKKLFDEGTAELAAAIYGMNKAGFGGGRIGKELGMSETHARNLLMQEKLRLARESSETSSE